MDKSLAEVLYRINVGPEISNDLLKKAMTSLLSEDDSYNKDVIFGAIMTGLISKGLDADGITTMLNCTFELDRYERTKTPKHSTKHKVIEYIGSGKKGVKTINISTPSAIVASSAGACILKKGSCSTSSVTGSADFMSIVGAKKLHEIDKINESLDQLNFAFVGIEDIIPKFDKCYGGKFYSPHILSFGLAAVVTPLRGDVVMYGLAHPDVNLSLKVLKKFGIYDAMIIASTYDGIHYMDEMGIYGTTRLVGMQKGVIGDTIDFNPVERLGIETCTLADIAQCNSPLENVKCVINILNNKGKSSQINIIAMNAANLLYLSDMVDSIEKGFVVAKEEILSRRPLKRLEEYIEYTGGDVQCLRRFYD